MVLTGTSPVGVLGVYVGMWFGLGVCGGVVGHCELVTVVDVVEVVVDMVVPLSNHFGSHCPPTLLLFP